MVSAGRDKVLIVWDLLERKQLRTVPVFESIESLSYIANKDDIKEYFIITAGETGFLRKWSFPSGRCVYADKKFNKATDKGEENSLALTHLQYDKGRNQLVAITYDHNIVFYNANNLQAQKQFIGYYDEIVDIKLFGEKQEYVVIASNSEQIKILRYGNMSTSEVICGHTDIVLSLDVSYDGKYIAACSKDNNISVWCKE